MKYNKKFLIVIVVLVVFVLSNSVDAATSQTKTPILTKEQIAQMKIDAAKADATAKSHISLANKTINKSKADNLITKTKQDKLIKSTATTRETALKVIKMLDIAIASEKDSAKKEEMQKARQKLNDIVNLTSSIKN